MQQPLVSIGIPTYNRIEGLRKAVHAITNQTYKSLEIIISDNASPDVSVQNLIASLAGSDTRIKVYRHAENIGAFGNFKSVLEKANGDYFMWAADDDWMDYNYIERCVQALEDNSCVAAYGLTQIHNPSGEFLKFDSEVNLLDDSKTDRVINYFHRVTHNGCFYGLMRRKELLKVKMVNALGGDWLMVAQLAFLGKYKQVEGTYYHITSGGMSASMEVLTAAMGYSKFTKAFPYTAIARNVVKSIAWEAGVYRSLSLAKRLRLAFKCFYIVGKRYSIKAEVKSNYKKHFRLLFNGK